MPRNRFFVSEFKAGDRVVSIAYHPPEVASGTKATVLSAQFSPFYAVQLTNGELHTWIADFELQAINPRRFNYFQVGDLAMVTTDFGHHGIQKGMIVRIVKVFTNTPFYDVRLDNGSYHRWLAEFELIRPITTSSYY